MEGLGEKEDGNGGEHRLYRMTTMRAPSRGTGLQQPPGCLAEVRQPGAVS